MADHTAIEWTDATWNPLRGCARVSDGCRHCYAERVASRFSGPGQPYEGLIHEKTRGWNGKVQLVPEALQIPWRWTRPRRIFVNSMSDLFHPDVPFEFIAAVFWVMGHTTRHTYQVLTKRPERMLAFFEWLVKRQESEDLNFVFDVDRGKGRDPFAADVVRWGMGDSVYDAAHSVPAIPALGWEPIGHGHGGYDNCGPAWPYENVWLGVSVEDQATANARIPLLLQTPAAVRWISAEPLLGPVSLHGFVSLDGQRVTRGLDWVVAGGESGPGARPMHPAWARSLRDQCAAARVPFLFKQWGAWQPICQMGETDELYHPAPARDPEAIRRCKVATSIMHADGSCRAPGEAGAFAAGSQAMQIFNVGKERAGRVLDGQLHDGYPGAAR